MTTLEQFSLAGRVAVVTGGSKGLGKSMARGFAEAGAGVVLCSRSRDGAEAAAREVREGLEVPCLGLAADVTQATDVDGLVGAVLEHFGRIDVWVNNAGINIRHPIEAFPIDEFERIVAVNLRGAWLCCRAVAGVMKGQRRGSVINVASVLGTVGLAERTAYCSSKFGVVGLTRALALEWAPAGVRCNALCPGPFLTEINHALLSDPAKVQAVVGRTALQRWAELEEIRGPALFLASDASSYMTGAALVVDGGWSAG
ncbi:MAG: glucose 1-dehydrogenase [Lentisphaeria bacterium]|nr:glucose 1-dehydrogenase [Lentisphaeria bacterium]